MAFTLDQVVPWGRSFDEYVAMFSLSAEDLSQRILGCGDGPANFNCVLTRRGGRVISADPLYRFSAEEIGRRIGAVYDQVMEQTRQNRHEFVWGHIPSIEDLGRVRMAAMNDFLSDFEAGLKQGRYVDVSLPALPFEDQEFDLALCSHFLFLYSQQLSQDFHLQSIQEMCRIAREARIFPVLELGSRKSRHLEIVVDLLRQDGFVARVEKVPYEFQKGGNEMLRVKTSAST
jgi:hypothetical protein